MEILLFKYRYILKFKFYINIWSTESVSCLSKFTPFSQIDIKKFPLLEEISQKHALKLYLNKSSLFWKWSFEDLEIESRSETGQRGMLRQEAWKSRLPLCQVRFTHARDTWDWLDQPCEFPHLKHEEAGVHYWGLLLRILIWGY